MRWKREKGGECSRFDAYNNIIIFWSDGNENTRWCIGLHCIAVQCGAEYVVVYCIVYDAMRWDLVAVVISRDSRGSSGS